MSTHDDTATDDIPRLDCGHPVARPSKAIPEIGRHCRRCFVPFDMDDWPTVLREQTYNHPDGKTTRRTLLMGIDGVGRAVYLEEHEGTLLRVVPRDHSWYDEYRSGSEDPIYPFAPRHGPRPEKPITVHGGHHAVVTATQKLTSGIGMDRRRLREIATFATAGQGWQDVAHQFKKRLHRHLAIYTWNSAVNYGTARELLDADFDPDDPC